MAKLTALSLQDARTHGLGFGIDVERVEPLDAGSVNSNFRLECRDGRLVFARIYEEQQPPGAIAELRLLRELSALGIPTATPLRRLDGSDVALHENKPLSVYPWVEGQHLCNQMVTEQHASRLGETLARVHLTSSGLSAIPSGRFDTSDIEKRLDWISRQQVGFGSDVAHIRERLAYYTERRQDAVLPTGLIHGDLFRDNVLWAGDDEIVALLDFESASKGVFAYDLMVCVLSWCYTDALVVSKARALVAGYQALRPLDDLEREALMVEGALACLRFATTRITDFSMRAAAGEEPKRDYRRFLTRLRELEQGIMKEVLA